MVQGEDEIVRDETTSQAAPGQNGVAAAQEVEGLVYVISPAAAIVARTGAAAYTVATSCQVAVKKCSVDGVVWGA